MTVMYSGAPLPDNTKISGKHTVAYWKSLCAQLAADPSQELWKQAFGFFSERLETRYFKPIDAIKKIESDKGEGFSIVAIQCSLIEFLEATIQGKIYRKRIKKDPPLNPHEYEYSGDMFQTFLKKRAPFSAEFDETLAKEFYENVRCGLLHEARTKGRWLIRIDKNAATILNKGDYKIYRNKLEEAFRTFLKSYEGALYQDTNLQKAFIIKMNSLCYE